MPTRDLSRVGVTRFTMGKIQMIRQRFTLLSALVACGLLATTLKPAAAQTILGTGTGALIGGDLTDPENDGQPDADVGYNASFDSSDEPGFGGGEFSFNVFDNQVGGGNAKWCCGNTGTFPEPDGHWIDATFQGTVILESFVLANGNDTPARDADHFAILGSNDGITYDVIYEFDALATDIWTERNQVAQWVGGTDFDIPTTAYSTLRFAAYDSQNEGVNGAFWQLNEIEYFGTLTPYDGDFNADGSVDLDDYQILRDNFNEAFSAKASYSKGDFNVDGVVDLADFLEFRNAYASAGAAAAVPEPGALALLGLGALAAPLFLRRSRR